MTETNSKYMARAREIADDGHCRYCHNAVLKCAWDIQDTTNQIARALERAALEARIDVWQNLPFVTGHNTRKTWGELISTNLAELRAQLAKLS